MAIHESAAARQLYDRLIRGDEQACFEFVDALRHRQEASTLAVCELLTEAFHKIGDAWQCSEISIYREHIASEIGYRILQSLRFEIPMADGAAPVAIGCTPEKDPYRLPTCMVELVLREMGWRSHSLGNNLPLVEMQPAIQDYKPQLCWVSASFTECSSRLHEQLAGLASFGRAHSTQVICGGRAIEPGRLPDSVRFLENLQHLARYVS